jgi:hypothetical protein
LDGVGGSVVLAGLPDDRIAVVLAALMDGHPHPQGEGGFAVADRLATLRVALVGRDAVAGIQLVEGLLGIAFGVGASDGGVAVGEGLVGQAGVVLAVAGLQVSAEAAGDGAGGPVLEVVAADGRRGLQVLQQLLLARGELVVWVGLAEAWLLGRVGV